MPLRLTKCVALLLGALLASGCWFQKDSYTEKFEQSTGAGGGGGGGGTAEWYYAKDGEQSAIMTLDQLVGELPNVGGSETLVFGPSTGGEWKTAAQVPEVAERLSASEQQGEGQGGGQGAGGGQP